MDWNTGCQCRHTPENGYSLNDWRWHERNCGYYMRGLIAEQAAELLRLREALESKVVDQPPQQEGEDG